MPGSVGPWGQNLLPLEEKTLRIHKNEAHLSKIHRIERTQCWGHM
jgi:hypothetical protein